MDYSCDSLLTNPLCRYWRGWIIDLIERKFNTLFSKGGGWREPHSLLTSFLVLRAPRSLCFDSTHFRTTRVLLVTLAIGCLVWTYHIFAVGIDNGSRAYYSIATIVIALPTGVKVFRWPATLL